MIFENEGTLKGWDELSEENKGSVEQVTSITFNGTRHALKFTQVYIIINPYPNVAIILTEL